MLPGKRERVHITPPDFGRPKAVETAGTATKMQSSVLISLTFREFWIFPSQERL